MASNINDNILSVNAVKKAMPACMVYAFVQSMTFSVDTIIAGHFLGTDAVAAIALGMPIIGLMLAFTAMIMQGAFLKLLNAMGRNNMDDYRRIYSLSLIFTIVVDCIFLAICLFATEGVLNIAGAAKATEEAARLGIIYVRTACLEILFFCVGTIFQLVIATYGYQLDRMISSTICIVVNVVSSIVFVYILPDDIAIAGLGIGSAIGTFAQLIVSYIMMKKRKISIKFKMYPLNKQNIVDSLDMVRRGFPSSIDSMLDSVSVSIVNRIILATFAAEGTAYVALVAILKTIYKVVQNMGRGVFYSSEPMVGILSGSKDNNGIKKTFKTALKYGLIYSVSVAAILLILKNPLLSFYNVGEDADAHAGMIFIAVSSFIVVIPFVFNAVYESTGHLLLSLAVSVIPDSILYPVLIPVLSGILGPKGIWAAMMLNFIPFFIVYYIIFMIIHRKAIIPLSRLLVLSKEGDDISELDVSISAEEKNVSFISEKLQGFLTEKGVDPKTAFKTALCTEEIAADYIAHRNSSEKSGKTAYMDIKVFRTHGNLEVILRNNDELYNPLVFEKSKDDFSKIGITMVQKISKEITHSYAYHLNIVTITMEA